jgi:hypothetical protein
MRIECLRRCLFFAWIVAVIGSDTGPAPSSAASVWPRTALVVRAASPGGDTRLGINVDDPAQSGSVIFTVFSSDFFSSLLICFLYVALARMAARVTPGGIR